MGQSGNPAKKSTSKKTPAKKRTVMREPERSREALNEAAKAAAQPMPSGPSDVKSFKKAREGTLLQLPSGLVIRALRVDLQTFILRGSVPNPLMEIVSEALEKGKKADIPAMVGLDEGKIDLETVNEMIEIVDAVLVESVLEPKVHPIPEDQLWNDELLYVNEVDPEDKMFIFQWAVGGTADVEQFREEARADLDALAQGQGAQATT